MKTSINFECKTTKTLSVSAIITFRV